MPVKDSNLTFGSFDMGAVFSREEGSKHSAYPFL
jgi:hypothetical protein